MAEAVSGIWVRALPPNNFFNIERGAAAAPSTGGGALYIEVPSSVVPSLLQLLGQDAGTPIPDELPIQTAVIGEPEISAPLVWRSKTGKRMRLFQNRQSGPDVRHPAWRPREASRPHPTASGAKKKRQATLRPGSGSTSCAPTVASTSLAS